MTSLPVSDESPNVTPIALGYATPQPNEAIAKVLGVISIVTGMLFVPLTCFMIIFGRCMFGILYEVVYRNNYVNGYELETLGFATILLGHLTAIRAGFMALKQHPRAAQAHRVYVRLMTYGAAAVLLGEFWWAGLALRRWEVPLWPAILEEMPVLNLYFGSAMATMLLYPAVVLRLKTFKKQKTQA